MVFSSTTFLFMFLPALLLLYFCGRDLRWRNAILLIFSLFFYADVKMGQGAIVIGLAAVIIGEAIFSKIFRNFALRLLSVVLGSIIYYIVVQAVITMGLDANLLKLLSAVIVAIFLALPYWKSQHKAKHMVKKGGKANA